MGTPPIEPGHLMLSFSRGAALFERQVAFLVLLAAPARTGIVAADARAGTDDGRGLVLHRRGARRRRRLAVGLDGRLLAALRQGRQRPRGAALNRLLRRGLLDRLDAHAHGGGGGGGPA